MAGYPFDSPCADEDKDFINTLNKLRGEAGESVDRDSHALHHEEEIIREIQADIRRVEVHPMPK